MLDSSKQFVERDLVLPCVMNECHIDTFMRTQSNCFVNALIDFCAWIGLDNS